MKNIVYNNENGIHADLPASIAPKKTEELYNQNVAQFVSRKNDTDNVVGMMLHSAHCHHPSDIEILWTCVDMPSNLFIHFFSIASKRNISSQAFENLIFTRDFRTRRAEKF